jgi:recombination protein RecA
VSTGSFNVDMLIGGTKTLDGKGLICPGFPRRRITEVYGAESSGKTTLLISAMVQAQRAGGSALLVDFEHSLDLSYAQKMGLSLAEDKMQVYQPETMESGFMVMFLAITGGVDIIGVDSVAAMVPEAELAKDFNESARIGAVAQKFSRDLPKFVSWLNKYPLVPGPKGSDRKSDPNHPGTALVFINQTRATISTSGYGGGGGNEENTSGGKALKFYAYERLRLSRIKSEVIEKVDAYTGRKKKYPYGNVTDVRVVKSKIDAKQGHSTQIFIRYGTGIDDYFSVIELGVTQKLIRRDGSMYKLGDQQFRGRDTLRKYLLENDAVFQTIRTKLAQLVNDGAVASDEPEEDPMEIDPFGTDPSEDDGDDATPEEVVSDAAAAE